MKKKLIISLIIIFLLLIILLIINKTNKKEIKIGSSNFYIEIPSGYNETEDDFSQDQIAYYFKDNNSIDFDIYEWSKEDKYTLLEEANYYASIYNTEATLENINSIKLMKYISKEKYNENEYTVINYMFEDEKNIYEIAFWTINTKKEIKDVEKIINTIKTK